MSVSLTRTVVFRATHRYYRPDWTEARNREMFGPLTEPPGHGHDYQCAVTVAGSLKLGTVGAVELLHSLQGGSRASTLGRALAELGRIFSVTWLASGNIGIQWSTVSSLEGHDVVPLAHWQPEATLPAPEPE